MVNPPPTTVPMTGMAQRQCGYWARSAGGCLSHWDWWVPSRPQSQPTPARLERSTSVRGSGAGAGAERAVVVARRRVGRCIVGGWIFFVVGWGCWGGGGIDGSVFWESRTRRERGGLCTRSCAGDGGHVHDHGPLDGGKAYVRITPRNLAPSFASIPELSPPDPEPRFHSSARFIITHPSVASTRQG